MAVMITTDKGDILEADDQPKGDGTRSKNDGNQLVRPGEVVTYLFKQVLSFIFQKLPSPRYHDMANSDVN